jgi:hypothetical protein
MSTLQSPRELSIHRRRNWNPGIQGQRDDNYTDKNSSSLNLAEGLPSLLNPEQSEMEPNTCTPMFIAALFTIAKLWKQPRCPTTDEWIKKMWYLYTMEFYAAMKKIEMLSFAGKWMELENIFLSEVSLSQKTKNRMFSLIFGH